MSANIANEKTKAQKYNIQSEEIPMVADPIVLKMTKEQLEKSIQNTTALMKEAAKNLDSYKLHNIVMKYYAYKQNWNKNRF